MDAQRVELPLMEHGAGIQEDSAPEPRSGRAGASAEAGPWLDRARKGEVDAFRQLVRLHQALVFSIALRFSGRRSEAEELAQDVFVQLHGALPQITSSAHLTHWLLRTVTHRCIDRQRQAQRRPRLVSIETIPPAAEEGESDAAGDPLASAHLRRLVRELSPDARAVVLLRFQEDLDPADIAATLQMSVNTVKSHLRRSLEWLRAQYPGDHDGY